MTISIGLPQFSHIDVDGFKHHIEVMIKLHLDRIDQLLKENPHYTWDNLMYPLDDLDDELERFWSPFSHLHSVMDSADIRKSYEACLPLLSAYEAAVGQNHELYLAIKSIDTTGLDQAQKKILTDCIQGFELSGVALPAAKKKRFEIIQARLSELSNQFRNNVLDAEQAFTIHVMDASRLRELPQHALHAAEELAKEKELKGYVLNLEFPCYRAVMTYCEDRTLREQMYFAYTTRASDQGPSAGRFDNTPVIQEMLALRDEKAKLLGFANYSELSLATKMAPGSQKVLEFLNNLIDRARPQAEQELKQLQIFANSRFDMVKVEPWDVGYLSEKYRIEFYSLSQEDLRPYFPLPRVMDGLFAIIKTLYGMTMEEIKGVDTWHKDVHCYGVIDEHNQVRGYIYTDLFARPSKQGGAWMDSLQTRRKLSDGHIQVPIATLTCNFAKPSRNKPAQLSHDELTTLFHEMGHCLHHILTQVDYIGAAGIHGVEWDAVELPSQFFENWCWDEESIALLTAHVDTQKPLPEVYFERLMAAKNYQSAMGILRQMEFALFDFRLHQYERSKPVWLSEVLHEVRDKTSLLPVAEYNRFQNSFGHIFGGGYAAGYYSYMWAEVLSSDAFSKFEEEGVLNPQTGRAFLNHILEVGGSMKAADAFKAFRGRDAQIDALLRHNGIQ